MNQITRINKYENILNTSKKLLKKLEKTLIKYNQLQSELRELDSYYGSEEWYQDVADDNSGLISSNINRGILSEDAVFDLLTENHDIAIKMLEVATNTLKNGR